MVLEVWLVGEDGGERGFPLRKMWEDGNIWHFDMGWTLGLRISVAMAF